MVLTASVYRSEFKYLRPQSHKNYCNVNKAIESDKIYEARRRRRSRLELASSERNLMPNAEERIANWQKSFMERLNYWRCLNKVQFYWILFPFRFTFRSGRSFRATQEKFPRDSFPKAANLSRAATSNRNQVYLNISRWRREKPQLAPAPH